MKSMINGFSKGIKNMFKMKDTQVEIDYLVGTPISIKNDAYNLTVAANLTKTCSPIEINYAVGKCYFVFILQLLISFFFWYDYKKMDKFQPVTPIYMTCVRIVFALLL